jgi:hypothetical protein
MEVLETLTKPLLYQLSYACPRTRLHTLHGFCLIGTLPFGNAVRSE